MFDKPFELEIVTPDRIVFQGEVTAVRVPGTQGGFQVLASHAPLMSSIEVGAITAKDTQGQDHRFSTSGGFVEVRENRMVVVAESAEPAGDIDVERARAAHDRAEKRLHDRAEGIDFARAEAALRRAVNRLRIAGKMS